MMQDTVPVHGLPEAEFSLWRYAIAAGGILALGVIVIARMVMLQTGPERQNLSALVTPGVAKENVARPRGVILDRDGHLLAGNRAVYQLDVDLRAVPADLVPAVAQIIGDAVKSVSAESLEATLTDLKRQNAAYVQIPERVTEEQKQLILNRVAALNKTKEGAGRINLAQALAFHEGTERYYPEGDLAANVLGFVSRIGGKGYRGVEEYYDDLLGGGVVQVEYSLVPWEGEPPVSQLKNSEPSSLYLTLDRALQHAAEEEAWRAVHDAQAQKATIIVADPYTGEILAMAMYPRPNLNDYDAVVKSIRDADEGPTKEKFNLALQEYEPGSVFKIITMAMALDLGTVTPQTHYYDTGTYPTGALAIYNWDRGAWGDQTMVTCLQHSLNTCLAWVATERVKRQSFYDYLQAFGFGRRTGIDLAHEDQGKYQNGWEFDLSYQAFGQGIDVTPVQMVAAASAIANGGYLVTPHVLQYSVLHGRVYGYQPEAQRQVISADTSATMRRMLKESLQGESSAALVPGYSVAGKTGTAEISENGQGYVTSDTNASFVGWFPAEEPRYLIYVWLVRPQRSKWASVVAAPVFSRMVQRIAVLEHVPPDAVREQIEASGVSQAKP